MSLILNTRLFIEWRRLRKLGGHSRNSLYEKGLLIYTALVFVSTMLMCVQQIAKAFAIITNNAEIDLWATMQFFWINDVMVCVPPFCLLMLSADLRNAVVKFLRCRRHRRGSTAPASIGNR
ncbi:hypothetical protein GCK32_005687 [Trichostrongylus colubriformis]|uniref:Serpentine receptor class gamma n=1 Tax=Trichostrongylus colubriformis TaxID=6319 RepID=A0AAN8FES4_TRICO